MANDLVISQENTLALSEKYDFGELIKPLKKELFLMETYIAGTSYRDKSIFEELKDNERLILKREPQNHFDDKAILVLDSRKRKLGYIPEKDNTVFSRLMDGGKLLFCKVTGIDDDGYKPLIDIGVYLEDF